MNDYISDVPGAPGAIGPYSVAVSTGDLVFISGQIPIDSSTGEIVPGGAVEQTTQVMKNLAAVLEHVGLSFANVVKSTIFLKSMDDFQGVNEVYASALGEVKPARATVEVSRLPKDVLVEIEMIASRS